MITVGRLVNLTDIMSSAVCHRGNSEEYLCLHNITHFSFPFHTMDDGDDDSDWV